MNASIGGFGRLLGAALLLGCIACGGGERRARPTITSITISPSTLDLQIGETFQLEPRIEGTGKFDPTLLWESSAPGVASVSEGKVRAIGMGEATIWATSVADPSAAMMATVRVSKAELGFHVRLDTKHIPVPIHGTTEFPFAILRRDGFEGPVTFSLQDLPPGVKAPPVTLQGEETQGVLAITADGSSPPLLQTTVELHAEGGGASWTATIMLGLKPTVLTAEDGAPGSLRSLLALAPEVNAYGQSLNIDFDPRLAQEWENLVFDEPLHIAGDVHLIGDPSGSITLSGGGSSAILVVEPDANVMVSHLHFTQGHSAGNGGAILNRGRLTLQGVKVTQSEAVRGGAIYNGGDLRIHGSTIAGNTGHERGGGIYSERPFEIHTSRVAVNTSVDGAGIYSAGPLKIIGSEVEDNDAANRGGGALSTSSSTSRIEDSTFRNNRAASGGGLVIVEGRAQVGFSHFLSNTAESHGGGIVSEGSAFTIFQTTFRDNRASHGGGFSANAFSFNRIMVEESHFEDNHAFAEGGGIYSMQEVMIVDSEFRRNHAIYGGAVTAERAQLVGSTFSGNEAVEHGGAVNVLVDLKLEGSEFKENVAGARGGGFHSEGRAVVQDASILGNEATTGGGVSHFGNYLRVSASTLAGNVARQRGGGLHYAGETVIRNSTFAANTANQGGAMAGDAAGDLRLAHATISGNHAQESGGGIFAGAPASFQGSILFGNTVGGGGEGPDLVSLGQPLASEGYNLIGSVEGAGGFVPDLHDLVGQDPLLGPLQDNGGPTQTMAIDPASPARDLIPEEVWSASDYLDSDQRSLPRPAGPAADAGAYELQP